MTIPWKGSSRGGPRASYQMQLGEWGRAKSDDTQISRISLNSNESARRLAVEVPFLVRRGVIELQAGKAEWSRPAIHRWGCQPSLVAHW